MILAAACSGGGGSTPAPNAAPATSGTAGSTGGASTNSPASLPPGTVGVTLTLKIPARKPGSAVHRNTSTKGANATTTAALARLAASRKPQFISPNTSSVQAVVTPQAQTALPTVTAACSSGSCSITIPVPLAVNSTVVLTLFGTSGLPIGQATVSFTAGEFTDGQANVDPTPVTFQPVIYSIVLDGGGATFTEGSPQGPVTLTVELYDADNYDVGSETDGVLDENFNPFTTIPLDSYGGLTFPGPATTASVNVAPTNAASDNAFSMSYDGTSVPSASVDPSFTAMVSVTNFNPLTTTHGMIVLPPAGYTSSSPFSIEYPTDTGLTSDSFTVTENIPSDASGGITVTTNELNGGVNASSNCASITNLTGGNAAYGSPTTITVTYNATPFNGVCTFEISDGVNPYQDVSIAVNNPTIYVQGKARK
jgi:hypothetical protein